MSKVAKHNRFVDPSSLRRNLLILLIDNYDSFVHNLSRYLIEAGVETLVARNDEISIETIRHLTPQAMVLSPGPCTPKEAGICLEVVRLFGPTTPLLGVCLGHQVIAEACGGVVRRSPRPMHGQATEIYHDGIGLFQGLPNPFPAGRYHSLIVETSSCPEVLQRTAWSEDGLIMGLSHRKWPVHGVQFHPESILTPVGRKILENFLQQSGIPHDSQNLPATDLTAGIRCSDFYARAFDDRAIWPLPDQD